MSLRDRPGPGVQGFPFYLCHSRVLFMSNGHSPEPGQGPLYGSPGAPTNDILEGLGKRSWEQGWWVGAQPSPHPQVPYCQEDLKLMVPWGSL